jgi:capsid protein
VDGIEPDEFGNPAIYHILRQHPGGNHLSFIDDTVDVAARFVLHWFQLTRGGQFRGVCEFKSSLNTGASSRRFREATVGAAESAADINVVLQTLFAPEDIDSLVPFEQAQFRKRMMVAMPDGWGAHQIKGEHPNATYVDFLKSQLTETGRPKSIPHGLTACDSSDANFASGKLDREAFYAALDVDREDGNDTVLDPLFSLWWAEAVLEYSWNADPASPPPVFWQWPRYPVADAVAAAEAIDKNLRNGSTHLAAVYDEAGKDIEDELPVMAATYGVTVDEMRVILRTAIFNNQNQQASMMQAQSQATANKAPSAPAPTVGAANASG